MPAIEDELIVGYAPGFRTTIAGWQHVYRQQRPAADGGVIRRVVFDNIENPHRRLLVDVAEFPSPNVAARKLESARTVLRFETADGARQFGLGSFAAPRENALSLHFNRLNLMIWIYSCGRDPVPVVPWADQILGDVDVKQTAEPGANLTLTPARRASPSEPLLLAIKSQQEPGEWSWRKFKAIGGTVTRSKDGDSLLLQPAAGASEVSVTGWIIEPGRATYAGRFTARQR